MRQVFRIMGMPDKVIAFDELPEDIIKDVDWHDCGKLPKDWREFIGLKERVIKVKPDINPITRQTETYPDLKQKGYFSYLLDFEVNKDKEIWGVIENYVKRNAPKDFRLTDKLIDMAKPMAADPHSELTLETEEVVVVPLPKIIVENTYEQATTELAKDEKKEEVYRCEECGKVFDDKRGIRLHKIKKHSKEEVVK